jgi:phage pi2 protein 07
MGVNKNMLKEKLRITLEEISKYPDNTLMSYLLGKGIINNPNLVREDDITNGDIVFYERN